MNCNQTDAHSGVLGGNHLENEKNGNCNFNSGNFFVGISVFMFTRKKPLEHSIAETEKERTETPEPVFTSNEKGDLFEGFVIQSIVKVNRVRLIAQVSDYNENGVFAEENFEPDLKFAQNSSGNFAVECKWRSRFQENGFIKWSYPEQIERYYRYQKENDVPVFIALGIGGQPDHPQEFYLVPLFRLTK